jgi:CBS domain containing-hemolysin-like protein
MQDPLKWFFLTLFFTAMLGFFSMIEMALVSFNKVRLQYYVSQKEKKAIWLVTLLQNPAKLFGTTLIGVNVAMFVGSECARQLFESLGWSPDLAPFLEVPLLVIFGELAPMFAARTYAETIAMMGAPLLFFSSKLMTPALFLVHILIKGCHAVIGGKKTEENLFLNEEELQKVLEEHEEIPTYESDAQEFNAIATHIFALKEKTAFELMEQIENLKTLPSSATVKEFRSLLEKENLSYVPVTLGDETHVVGIAFPRDLIRARDERALKDFIRPPWFVTKRTKAVEMLDQFRKNNQSLAVIINDAGQTCGLCSLTDITQAILGVKQIPLKKLEPKQIIERSFPANMSVKQFNHDYGVILSENEEETLADLMIHHLGHRPEEGETISIDVFELTAKETSLLEIKTIGIKTKTKA